MTYYRPTNIIKIFGEILVFSNNFVCEKSQFFCIFIVKSQKLDKGFWKFSLNAHDILLVVDWKQLLVPKKKIFHNRPSVDCKFFMKKSIFLEKFLVKSQNFD